MNIKGEHTPEDYAQNLRTVHLTLIAVGVALIVAAQLEPDVNLTAAKNQLFAIETVTHDLSIKNSSSGVGSNWVVLLGRKLASMDVASLREDRENNRVYFIGEVKDGRDGKYYEYRSSSGNEIPLCPIVWEDRLGSIDGGGPASPSDATVGGFQKFWNGLRDLKSIHVLTRFGKTAFISEWVNREQRPLQYENREATIGEARKERLGEPFGFITGPIILRDRYKKSGDSIDGMQESLKTGYESFATHFSIGQIPDGPGYVFFPLYYSEVQVDLQDHLRKLFAENLTGIPLGTFEQSFPDLYKFSKQLEAVKLSDLRVVLTNELARSGDKIQVLGLFIPPRAIRSWGIIILLGVQLYFLIHLRAFEQVLTAANKPSIAWIALYGDWLSTGATLLTAVLLPATVIVFLVKAERRDSEAISSVIGGSLLIAIVALWTTWVLLSLTRKIRLWDKETNAKQESLPNQGFDW